MLTQAEADRLPVGAVVVVVWSGGNGPHEYTVTSNTAAHGVRLASRWEVERGLPGMNWLDRVGPPPLTTARLVDAFEEVCHEAQEA